MDKAEFFVGSINSHNLINICQMMTINHCFTDASGQTAKGKPVMEAGWECLFSQYPNYQIYVAHAAQDGDTVLMLGQTYGQSENPKPTAWRIKFEGDLIDEWQVYEDNESIAQIGKLLGLW